MPRVVPAVLMAAAAAFPASAQDWGQLATISSTLGVNANRLCIGEGLRADIGCPAYAPYVSATSGFVGIGTSSPSRRLVVNDPTGLGGNPTTANYVAQLDSSGAWGSPGLLFTGSTNGASMTNGASIEALSRIGGIWNLTFKMNPNGFTNTLAPVMTLITGGNVGIGTTNPNAKLEVNGTVSATNLRLSGNLYVSGSQTFDGVTFANGGVSATGIITATSFSGDGSRLTGLASGDRIVSGTTNVIATQDRSVTISTAGTQRVVVGENGNVGIGTTFPSSTLHVAGRATIGLQANTNNLDVIKGITIRNTNGSGSNTITFDSEYAGHQDWSISHNQPTLSFLHGTTASMLQMNGSEVRLMQFHEQYGSRALFQATSGTPKLEIKGHNSQAVGVLSVLRGSNQPSTVPTIYTDGSAGIGTQSPTATLQVSGSFTVSTSTQATTPSLYVGTNGNVGIGTSAPSQRLDVAGSAAFGFDSGTTASSVIMRASNDWNTLGGQIEFKRGGTSYFRLGTPASVTLGGDFFLGPNVNGTSPYIFAQRTTGNIGIGTTTPSATLHVSGTARITSWTAIAANVTPTTALDVYGTISATNLLVNGSPITGTADRITSGTTNIIANTNGAISFTTAGTERLTLSSTGDLGIGTAAGVVSTSSPLASWDAADTVLTILGGGSASEGILELGGLNTANGAPVGRLAFIQQTFASQPTEIQGVREIGNGQIGLAFRTYGSERVRISNGGNVGIGTSSPAKTLDVSGTAQVVSRTLIGGTGTPSATLQVSGSLLLAGNDNIPCTDSALGLVRRNPTTGRLQACR